MEKQTKGLIDCDVHNFLDDFDELVPYLDESWQKMMNIGKFKEEGVLNIGSFQFPHINYSHVSNPLRSDAITPSGGYPGSDPAYLVKDLFEKFDTTYGILNVGHGSMSAYHNIDLTNAYSTALNDWQLDKWIAHDPRYKMTLVCSPLDPKATVKEIERIGHLPGVVGVNLQNVNIPMGNRHFWEIFEAAEHYGLPIVLHPDTEGAGEYAPSQFIGPASTYMEWHTTLPMVAQRQITSLLCEGVFAKFPKLKFVFLEYGFSWIASLMWRIDKNWKALRDSVPWVKRLPSEYIRENVRFGLQPIEEPFAPKDLITIIEMIQAEDMILFSSDYPHWDGEFDTRVLLHFPKGLKQKVLYDNAIETFNFQEEK